MTVAARKPKALLGHAHPRVGPPVPARSDIAGFREVAAGMGISLMPWQDFSGRVLTARGRDDLLLYREVCIVVARQNGKTTLMKPHIIRALRAGKRIVHIAQTRELPRHMFSLIADALATEPDLFPKRRGKVLWPRYGSGQEEIVLANGGEYRIAAAGRGGARGLSTDLVIIDELREMDSFEVIQAAEPTLTMSADPQIVYLSNAGHDGSVVLNDVRNRAGQDASLAYLEWSASPERAADDLDGWAEANPALGHYPAVMRSLEAAFRKHKLAGSMSIFETEHLCRWVPSMRERLVDEFLWREAEADSLTSMRRPFMGVAMDPEGTRASAVVAWRQPDDTVALTSHREVTGEPIDTDMLGKDLRDEANRLGVVMVGFDPMTDKALARWFRKSQPVGRQDFVNASARFVTAIEAHRLRWKDAAAVGEDLTWTARKEATAPGSFEAVRADDDRPITAALAAVRAVWLASEAKRATPRIY